MKKAGTIWLSNVISAAFSLTGLPISKTFPKASNLPQVCDHAKIPVYVYPAGSPDNEHWTQGWNE